MKEKNKRIVRRWMSTALIITMLFACVINDISLPYISWAGESASASDARNKRVTLVKTGDEDVQITVLSDEQSYESGDDVCLELVITNNSDGEIKDGVLKYGKSSGIEADTAYFEDVNDAYVQNAQVIRAEKDKTDERIAEESKEEESSKASEPETTETAEPEVSATTEGEAKESETPEAQKPKTEEENDVKPEEIGEEAEEDNRKNDKEDDEYPQYLSELNIAPGESYHVNFYYTVAEDIEKIANKGIEFTFRGIKETEIKDEYGEVQDTETKNFTISKKFLYTVNGMNLLPVAFAGDKEGKLIRGEEAKMTLDFSLGNLEAALDEWAMENDNGDVSTPSDSSSDKKASESNAPRVTSALIKWEGDKKAASTDKKEEQPIVQNLHCDVEIPGVTLNDFMVTDDASEDDDYNTSAVCSFTIDRKTKPGTYYGEVKATYDVKDGKRKASGKTTQGIVLVVSQTKDEAVLEVIGLIDELPESDEVMEKMTAFEEAEDDEAWEAYYMELSAQVQVAYTQYDNLTDEQKEMVDNSEKLMGYVELFGVRTLALPLVDTVPVYAVNKSATNGQYPIIIHSNTGQKITEIVSVNRWWYFAEVISKDGNYVVNEVSSSGIDNKSNKVCPNNGFILLWHDNWGNSVNVQKGDYVTVSSDFWKGTKDLNTTTPYGTVTFSKEQYNGTPKPDKNNGLNPIQSADTSKLITVNLYDYDTNINEKYNSDHKYPGFQNPYGTRDSSGLNTWNNNFGDNITGQGKSLITTAANPGLINVTNAGANKPLENGAMSKTLGKDGYPALQDGTSLSYLFTDNTYARKQNTKSINGLFRYKDSENQYYFNSRENHAEFDSSDDTFKLYHQIITSNYTMYPFGNFLPLNKINTECKQVSQIDRAYTKQIADSAQYKFKQNKNTEVDKYDVLAGAMNSWISAMDTKYGTGWTAENGIDAYFGHNGIPTGPITSNGILDKLYSIDYDEKTNFFFGMEMEMNFIQPKDGKIKIENVEDEADDVMNGLMKFYFTGDDDVWVYVDGVLFLDLSGIHRHVGGDIDFTNGEVHYYELKPKENGDIGEEAYSTKTFEDILTAAGKSTDTLKTVNGKKGPFNDYSTHNFKFYYMERGSGSGVCRMNFNFPILDQNKIHVMKELTVENHDISLLGDPDFRFQILKAHEETKNGKTEVVTEGPLIGESVAYKVFEGSKEIEGNWVTGENGIFTIKAGQRAEFDSVSEDGGGYIVQELIDTEFFDKYAQFFVGVDGSSITTNAKDVIVGNDKFHGIQSNIKQANDGKLTVFQFNNQLEFDKLGNLEISKELEGNASSIQMPFTFEVTLDGKAIPAGTKYTITGKSPVVGVNEPGNNYEVSLKDGKSIIKLFPGQTAKFSNIIAGTKFTVEEIGATDYTVSYKVDNQPVDESKASGVIGTDEHQQKTVQVNVKNTEHNVELKIPVKKMLKSTDGKEHTYRFELKPVNLVNGSFIEIPDATHQEVSVTVKPSDNNGISAADNEFFKFSYYVTEVPQTYYYRVSEIAESSTTTLFDPTVYIIKVDINKETDTNKPPIAATVAYKEENEPDAAYKVLDLEPGKDAGIPFTNTLLRDLLIEKQLEGTNISAAKEFSFEIVIHNFAEASSGDIFDAVKNEGKENEENVKVTFADGKTTVKLKGGETLRIHLPYNANYTISEINTDGYHVSHKVNEGTEQEGSVISSNVLTDNVKVTFINSTNQRLPGTGGPGTLWYTFGGFVLMAFALMYNILRRRKVLI